MSEPDRFDCHECGVGVKVDEDHCCAHCGRDAIEVVDGLPVGLLRDVYHAPPSEPAAPAPDPFAGHSDAEVDAALDEVRGKKPAAPARHHFETCPHGSHMEVCKDAPAQRAEAPDPERDRNRHNAMLVEAWRGEFGALCKALFPGDDGPIGWKHIHAKIAELIAARAAPHGDKP